VTPAALHDAMHALLREVTAKIILPRYQKLAEHEVAAKIADDVVTVADHESEAMLAEGLASDYAFYQRFESEEALAGKDVRIISMKHAILHFRHRKLAENTPEKAVSVALVTGSLGPGGAERQLTRLAGELTRLAASPEQQPPDILMRPKKVEVLVKQHTEPSGVSKKQDDFFLPVLIKAQIPVTEINRLPAISVAHQALPEGSLGRLLEQLPPREKKILLLRFFGNMTQSQIAQEVGISQMHVSRLLARTLAQLRDKLLVEE